MSQKKKTALIPAGTFVSDLLMALTDDQIRELRKGLKALRKGEIDAIKMRQLAGLGPEFLDSQTLVITHERMME